MKKMNKSTLNGFVGINSGEISDCYTEIKIKKGKEVNGFCNLNLGEINHSYSNSHYKKDKNINTFSKDKQNVHNCFQLQTSEKTKNQSINNQNEYIKSIDEINQEYLKSLQWDVKDIWIMEDGLPKLKNKNVALDTKDKKIYIEIDSAEKLHEVADKVSSGIVEYVQGYFILTKDIDLKKKKLKPIGTNELAPFCGTFNGNGYTIKNYVISEPRAENLGFFGYMKNATVANLCLEGSVKGGKYTGALAGVNDMGTISCCFTKSNITGGFCVGGLVGKNSGEIKNCACGGVVSSKIPGKYIAGGTLVLAGVATAACVTFFANKELNRPTYYPPVPVSEFCKQIKGDHDTPTLGANKVAFSFATEIKSKSGKDNARINFQNPGRSSHHIAVQIQITDAELIKAIGKNGRTKEEQNKLKSSGQYKSENMRVIVGESGSIPPGFQLKNIKLSPLPDGTILPNGTYNAIVYLTLYDVETNELAMVNSQTPVKLVLGNENDQKATKKKDKSEKSTKEKNKKEKSTKGKQTT